MDGQVDRKTGGRGTARGTGGWVDLCGRSWMGGRVLSDAPSAGINTLCMFRGSTYIVELIKHCVLVAHSPRQHYTH